MDQASCETLFRDFDVRESINVLHHVVTDARGRKQRDETEGKDIWKVDLEPRAAVRARTVPVLEAEVERLKETATNEENQASFEQLKANVRRQQEADAESAELLKNFDEIYSRWRKLPHDEISLWALRSTDSIPPAQIL
ncbi:hypothetical protein JVU11DRAFT_10557 [Chiua virens]|nr:hypothetical protein JVU11DRAFT_10557 [Chiua virens]